MKLSALHALRACALALTCIAGAMLTAGTALAQYQEPQVTDQKLFRTILSGRYDCRNIEDKGDCGSEQWKTTVNQDGTRILRAFSNWSNRASQLSMVLRVDAEFRPLDAFVTLHNTGKFVGSGFYVAQKGELVQTINSPEGLFTEKTPLPEHYSIALHPISADSWHSVYYDKAKGGVQESTQCILGLALRSAQCAMVKLPMQLIGKERITVPAGTFDTEHYSWGAWTQVWVMDGPDRPPYKGAWTRYQLAEFERVTP